MISVALICLDSKDTTFLPTIEATEAAAPNPPVLESFILTIEPTLKLSCDSSIVPDEIPPVVTVSIYPSTLLPLASRLGVFNLLALTGISFWEMLEL